MPIFTYSAAGKDGKVIDGSRDAEDEKSLAQTLKKEGFYLLDAREKKPGGWSVFSDLGGISGHIFPVSLVEKMFFARNLAVMVDAGLSLTRALDALGTQTTNEKMRQIIKGTAEEITKGKPFAEALRTHQKVFGVLFINMIEVGEATGKLTTVLRILARQMKKDYDLRRRVRGAMMYPAVILMALAGVGILMMLYVVPGLVSTIRELGIDLPLSTRIIIRMSDAFTRYGLWLLAAVIAASIFFWRILETKAGKYFFDRTLLKVPVFGSLAKKFNLARFARVLSYLISAGVPIIRSLEITSTILGNSLFRDALKNTTGEVEKGKSLHETLGRYPALFSPMVIQMISVGEETGKISSMLLRLAIFFESDVNETTKNLSTIIEPILMIVIGVVVGFFAVAMFQPIYGSLGSI